MKAIHALGVFIVGAGLAVALAVDPAHAQSAPAAPATPPPGAAASSAQAEAGEPRADTSAQAEAGEPRANTSAQAEAGEPRADTSSTEGRAADNRARERDRPAGPDGKAPAHGGKDAKPGAADRLELGVATVTGDREQPKVMYIVPWKKSDIGDLSGKPMNSLLDEALAPVDRDVFKREVIYYTVVKADASQNGAPKPPAQGEK